MALPTSLSVWLVNLADVVEALRHVIHPEIPVNIVDLGLVYSVSVREGKATIELGTTSHDAQGERELIEEVRRQVMARTRVTDVQVAFAAAPTWVPEMMNKAARSALSIRSDEG